MKKTVQLMMLLVAMLLPWAASAQETLTVYEGTTTNTVIPAYMFYFDDYTRSQVVIPAADLSEMSGATISEMKFYTNSTNVPYTSVSTVDVYLMEVGYTTMTGLEPKSNGTIVYSGTLSVVSANSGGEMTITFSTPYTYNGGNLLIGIENTTDAGYKSINFYGQTVTGAAWGGSNTSSLAGVTGSVRNFIPKTTFTYESGNVSCYGVKNLSLVNTMTTPHSMTLRWLDTNNSDGVTYTIVDMTDTSILASGITDTFYTFNNLTSNTNYSFGVYAKCAADDSSRISKVDGRTPCEAITTLPYEYGFEDASTSGATGTYSPCWARRNSGLTTNYPYPYNTYKHSGIYSLFLNSTASAFSWTALPAFSENITNLYLNFWAYKTAAAQGKIVVGVMRDPDSINTFDTVKVLQVQALNTWEEFDVDLSTYTGTGSYIAILSPKVANNVYIDDITVMETPACIRPQALWVEDLRDATATLRWSPSVSGATGYTVKYGTTNFDPETATDVTTVDITNGDSVAHLTGLTGSTTYHVYVSATCGDSPSRWTYASFKTRCAAIETLPYNYGFEDASGTTATSTINACWTKGTNSTTAYPYPNGTTYHHGGSKNLYFYSTSTTYCYAAMPAFAAPVNTLRVSFWGLKTSAAYGHITVGVMSNPDDINTFEPVVELQVQNVSTTTNQQWEQFEVPLVNYTGTGSYIAFLCPEGATNHIYIDDITVDEAPNCLPAEQLHVDAVSSTGATLLWNSAGSYTGYRVLYDSVNFNPDTASTQPEEIVNITGVVLSDLTPNTTYYVYVQTLCSNDTVGWANLTFTTLCEPIDELPWSFDPDGMATATTATDIECFGHLGGGYVNIQTRTGFTGNTVRFYPNSSTKPNILILPDFDEPLSNLYMVFRTAPEGSTSGSISVGYITDLLDSTTFVEVGRYPVSYFNGSGSIVPAYIDALFTEAPTGARIAFRHNVESTSWFWFLDEITVMELPSCFRPDSVTVSDLEGTSATLNIHSSGTNDWLVVMPAFSCDTCDTSFVATGSTLYLEDLTPGTYYSGSVYATCNGDTSIFGTPFAFVTACVTLELPVVFDAEGAWQGALATPQRPCWDFLNYGYASYNWRYNATATNAHEGTKSYHYYGGTSTTNEMDDWMITPTLNFTGFEAVSMWVKTSSTTTTNLYHGRLSLYATVEDSATSADTANFYRLTISGDSVQNNRVDFYGTTWQYLTLYLPDDLIGEHRLAFVVDTQSYTFYADEINIYTRSACPTVQEVQVVGIGSDTARISWVDTNHIGNYIVTYWPEGDLLTADDTITVPATDTVITLENLSADSIYYVVVQADCGDLSMATYPVSFRTRCEAIPATELPYVENFDTYGSGSAQSISTCWTKDVFGSTTLYPYPYSTGAITGTRCLYFYSSSSVYDYAAMPLFETDLNDLMLSFSVKRYSTSSYKSILLVGVMSNPDSISTFDTIATFDISSEPVSTVHRFLMSFENYNGNGSYIAFMAPKSTTTNYIYLDSVVVDLLPACRWPSNLVVDTVTSHSAALSWTGSGNTFQVEASLSPDFTTIAVTDTVNDTTVAVVTGLNDYSQYYFRVRALCGEANSFWSNTATGITAIDCGDGYETVYDTLSYGTTTSYSYVINGYSSYTNTASWHIYTPTELADLGMTDTLNYIRGISLETGTVGSAPLRFRVYMATTTLDEWHSATSATSTTGLNDTLPISSMQLVYDGSVTFEANSWNDIALNTPFLYSGEENLVVAFVRDSSITGTYYFKYGSSATYSTAYKYRSGSSSYAYRNKYNANIAFVTCNHIPSCPKPLNVVTSNVTADGFDLAWTGSSDGYKVVVSTASIADPSTAVASDDVIILMPTTNQVSVTGLTPQTTYYYYLRSECGTEQSSWTAEGSIMTLCTPKTIPFHEDFNGMASLSTGDASAMVGGAPTCWDMTSDTTGSYLALYHASAYLYGGSGYSLKFKAGANNKSTFAILPEFTQPINTLELTFQTRPEGTSASSGDFYVGYMTDPADPTTFVATSHYVYSDFAGAYQEKTVTFYNAPAGARIALRHTPTGSGWFWFVDEIDVHEAPTCPYPDSLSVSMLTDGSVKVSWVDHNNSNISYEVEYGEAGFEHGEGTTLITAADSVIIPTLGNSRRYQVYVRALCSADDNSVWTSPVSFSTTCGPVSLPYSIDWEQEANGATAALPHCWQRFNNGGSTAYPYVNSAAANAHNGTKYVYYYFTTTSGYATDEAFISPAIDTASYPIDNIEVSFWAKSTVANRHFMVGVMSGTSTSTFSPIGTVTLSTTYAEYTLNTAAYTGNGDRIAFRAMMDTTASYSIYLDEVYIGELPPCPRVYNLTAADATQNSVVLGWTDPTTTTTSWVIEYKEAGVANATAQTTTATSNPFTLTGLTPMSTYVFRVAPVCASGDTSAYSRETGRFFTSQVPATMPYSYDFEDSTEWANWQTASSNNVKWYRGTAADGNTTNVMYLSADNGATNSWRRNTTTNVAAYRDIDFGSTENSYEVNFTYHGGGLYAGNYDGISVMLVDPAVEVNIPNTYLDSPWGRVRYVQARMDTLWGTHTARLDGVSGVKRLVFYHFNNAESHDTAYLDIAPAIDNISIVPQECVRPYNLMAENITSHAATLTWTGDAAALYRIRYKADGTNVYVYDTITGLRYRVSDLPANTTYTWAVEKICSLTATDTLISAWSLNASFATRCATPLPYSESFEGVTGTTYNAVGVLPDCWKAYSNGTSSAYMPHVTGSGSYHYPHDSINCLTMTSGSGTAQGNTKVVALPSFTLPVNSLTMTFWYRMESATSGVLTVGYVTDEDNLEGSFVPVKTVVSTTTITKDSLTFDTVSSSAKRLAFRWYHNSTFYSVGIDDINVWSSMEECETPTNLVTSSLTHNSAELTWDNTADNFEVYFMRGIWREPEHGTVMDTNVFNANDLDELTTYSFGVRALCAAGYYSDWIHITFTTNPHPCYTPTGLAVSATTYDGGTLNWTAGEEGQEHFEVHVFNTTYDHIYTVDNATTLALSGLYSNTEYHVAVRAVCGENDYSEWSDTIQLTPDVCPVPTNIVATAQGRVVTVNWASTGATRYRVTYFDEYSTINDAEHVEVENATSTTVTVERGGMDYSFYVQSYCGEVLSNYSAEATVTIVGIDAVDGSNIRLFPNPATTSVTLSGIEGPATVTVVDLNGRTSGQWTVTDGQLTIDLTGYAQGAYFIRIAGEQAAVVRKLIVK